MTRIKIILLLSIVSFAFNSCKKPAGEGGNSTITGKVWVEDWDKNFVAINYQYAGVDEDVYIIYGDNVSYGDRVKTNHEGEFEFKYLRPGKYTIYTYSDEKQTTASQSPQTAKIVEVEITGKKQTVDAGKITVKR